MFGQAEMEPSISMDPMFIPAGFDKTLGELDDEVKKELSHRAQAMRLAQPIIQMLKGK